MIRTFAIIMFLLAAPWYAAAQGQGAKVSLPPANVQQGPDTGGGLMPPQPAVTGGQVNRFLRVTGSGVVRAKPGEAHIVFLVSTTAATAVGALQDNGKQRDKVVNVLHDRGVPADNINWSESSLAIPPHPVAASTSTASDSTDSSGGAAGSSGGSPGAGDFTANARIDVITREVSHATDIVEIGMYGGATSVLGMTFEPRDIEDQKQQALIAALKDAASKAAIMAAGIKVRVLYAISVSELPSAIPEIPGLDIAPPSQIAVPINIEVVYAVG